MKFYFISVLLITLLLITYLAGCGSSSESEDRTKTDESTFTNRESEELGNKILAVAKTEQEKEMYSPEVDSTYLYWLNNRLLVLNGSTKCNIFALNVLYKAGFKTPDDNALSRDLFDTSSFREILPVIGVNETSRILKGDIIAWRYHVIIFESLINLNNDIYALGYWAGTRQIDNDDNIKNNVCHGKYKLDGDYVVRRPVRK